MNHGFSEMDQQKVIQFLNTVAEKAKFNVGTVEMIEYVKLLTHMQQVILPKIEGHILELRKVVEPPKEEKKPPKAKAK